MKGVATLSRLDHPGLVPASLLPPEDPSVGVRRTVRDWLVDSTLFAGSALLGLILLDQAISSAVHSMSDLEQLLDVVLGALSCLALWWRRRWPVRIALATSVLAAFAASAGVANLVAVFTVAVHRRTTAALLPAAAAFAAGLVFTWWIPYTEPFATTLTVDLVVVVVAVALGMVVRARRQLVWSLRERAERAEAEQRMLADQARVSERARIAREMHDVLAHRISLLALHAGGLEVQPTLPAEKVRETAALLRSTAHQALEELRDVIGVLRGPETDSAPSRPQPGLGDIARLVAERRATGAKIDYLVEVEDDLPAGLGRDAYRIVQEALTNAGKHAPGTTATVRVHGNPEEGVSVTVRNLLPVGAGHSALPGSGTGLIGIGERVELAGGTLRHGRAGDAFVVEAMLPWR